MIRTTLVVVVAILCAGCSAPGQRGDLFEARAAAARAYSDGDLDKAERLFTALTERVPGEAEFWFRLGNIHARTHRPEEAIRCYREALVREPDNAKAWHNMGIVYLRQAGNAFTQLTGYLEPEDAFYTYSLHVNETILDLLNPKRDPGIPAPPELHGDVAP